MRKNNNTVDEKNLQYKSDMNLYDIGYPTK